MLAARYAPRFRTRRHEPAPPRAGARSAIVVGAGLAGCASALALARRGWAVRLLDLGDRIAGAASALPAGLLHPSLAIDDNLAARLSRAGFLAGRQQLDQIDPGRAAHRPCGVFELAPAGARHGDWRARLLQQHWPGDLVRWCEPPDALALTGFTPREAGFWFPGGAVVDAGAWCRAMVGAVAGIRWEGGCHVIALQRHGAGWIVADAGGRRWEAAAVVVAASLQSAGLAGLHHAPAKPVRGRISLLEAPPWRALRAGIAGRGYLMPVYGEPRSEGRAAVGATYEVDEAGAGPALSDERAHQGNLARLQALLQDAPPASPAGLFDAIRCVAPDRTPYAGPACDEAAAFERAGELAGAHLEDLPRQEDLYCVAALGSRGLSLAPLLGELVAAQAEGEPLPIERSLARCVDPGRFLLRRLRRGAQA